MQTSKITLSFTQNTSSDDGDTSVIELTTSFDEFMSTSVTLLENLPNAMCVVDNKMIVRLLNKKFRHLTGIRHLLETTFRDLMPKSQRVLIVVEQCIAMGKAMTLHRNIIAGDMVKHEPYLIQVQPLIDKQSAEIRGALITFSEDLGEYKKHFLEDKHTLAQRVKVLSKDVLEKQYLIRTLLDKSPFGIALLDTNRQVIQINNSAAQILGINKRQAVGLSCENIFQCYSPTNGCPVLENHLPLDREETQCVCGNCLDKTLLRSVLISNDRDQEIILEAFIDITEIKEAAAAKEMAYQAKNDFFSKMSHELRTPLNAIIGYSELISEDIDSFKREEMLGFTGAIQRGGYDLLHLVDQVLDLSKIEDGRMRQEFFTKSVSLMVLELESTIHPLAEKGNNELQIQCQADIDTLYAEHEHLRRILLNLLGNACKFTENGRISLYINREILDGKPWICFAVSDTGIGLTTEQLQRVFDRFEQADNSTTRRFGGSGLGLTIANELCEMMGGHIRVESEPQIGSTFSVWIPEIKEPNSC